MKGIVKRTPIQKPIKPTKEPKKATNKSRNSVRNCELVKLILVFIAAIAFCLPKIISGVLKTVTIPIANEIIPPNTGNQNSITTCYHNGDKNVYSFLNEDSIINHYSTSGSKINIEKNHINGLHKIKTKIINGELNDYLK